jgi:aspartate racemase
MKNIGLIGGMSWHSTAEYYRVTNKLVAERLGGHASARITLQSLNFAEVRDCQQRGDWDASGQMLAAAARRCVAGGAELVALCTNLMHKNFAAIEAAVGVPAIHIADAVAGAAQERGYTRLGLLGTRWVMEETFYADRLAGHGIEVLVPEAAARVEIDRVIFEEITQGHFLDASREFYLATMSELAGKGAQAAVLACTEIGLLVPPADAPLPAIDSMQAHARLLVDLALTAD